MKYIFIVVVAFFFFSCDDTNQKMITGLEGKPLPSFKMLLTDSSTNLKSENISVGQPFVLFYFSPDCPYCRAQTEEFKADIEDFKNIRLYFVSHFPLKRIKDYGKLYGLDKYSNITLAQIRDTAFTHYFKIPGFPYFAIYDKEKRLKEIMLGKVSVKDIKDLAIKN